MEFLLISLAVVATVAVCMIVAASSGERRAREIQRQLALLLHHFGIDPTTPVTPSERVRQLAAAGQKLEAVRLYRKETFADLKSAARVIDSLQNDSKR